MNDSDTSLLKKSIFRRKEKLGFKRTQNSFENPKKLREIDPDLTTYYLRISSFTGPFTKMKNSPSLPALNFLSRGKQLCQKLSILNQPEKPLFSLPKPPLDSKYKFVIFPGNNSEAIKKIMKTRENWEEIPAIEHSSAHFIWQPIAKSLRFDRLLPYLPKQMANHFEHHFEITDKRNLCFNLSQYCEEKGMSIDDMVPKTFFIEFNSSHVKAQIKSFICYFKSRPKKPASFWIFKPSGLNRGQGISLFTRLSEFKSILKSVPKDSDTVIVQKYIENPLLLSNRKFDIRVWVLITHEYKCFFCKEGYIRTSSEEFSLSRSSIHNKFVHLTNNAVQQKSSSYSKFEDGNQIDLRSLESVLPTPETFETIYQQIQDLVVSSLLSVKKKKLNPHKRQYCFEIFGYDFLIDSDFKPWLIECNTNPCLELSSKLLENLIPRMLDQALGLTIDKLFHSPKSEENTLWKHLTSI